jgi:hypothetical protein
MRHTGDKTDSVIDAHPADCASTNNRDTASVNRYDTT